jgi:FMN phosphatase YigB (HAD superfamily)
MKVLVLDLDGTIVDKDTWMELVKGAFGFCIAPYLFYKGFPLAAGAALYMATVSYFTVPIFEDAKELVCEARERKYQIYVNTSRPWPFISFNVLSLLWVNPSHIYFRSARTSLKSKVQNMESILASSKCEKENIVFVEDQAEIVTALRREGYKVIFTPKGIRGEDISRILDH